MPCIPFTVNGANGILCTRGGKLKKTLCKTCSAPAPYLCDYEIASAETACLPVTCDEPMCAQHATEVGPDRHHCPVHTKGGSIE